MLVKEQKSGISKYSIEERIEAVRSRMYQELSYAEILSRYGISNSTLAVWIKRFKGEVLRRESSKGIPLYVRKYQESMTPEEEQELDRLRRENAELKLIHEANELMIKLAKERLHIDIKKNYEEMLSAKLVRDIGELPEVPQ